MEQKQSVSLARIQILLVALGALMIVVIWALYLYQSDKSRQDRLDAHAAEHLNVAVMTAEHLRQIIDRAAGLARLHTLVGSTSRDVGRLLSGGTVFNRLGLYGPDGQGRFFSHASQVALPEAWLKQMDSQLERHGFTPFFPAGQSPPGFDQRWVLPLLVPLPAADGIRLEGMLLLEVNLGFLTGLYQHIELGRTGLLRLIDRQGEERLRANDSGMVEGGAMMSNAGWPKAELTQGRLLQKGGQSLFYALPEHGFSIVIDQQYDEILAGFYYDRHRQWLLLFAVSLMIAAAVVWLIRLLQRQQRFVAALEQSEQQNRQLIERLEQAHDRSSTAAATDHLTGLLNRRRFIELAGKRLAGQRRELCALLYIDMDRFKSINDTLGHHTGDLLLQAVAGRIGRALDDTDLAARFGGDEFVVLLGNMKNEAEIEQWAGDLSERLSETYKLDGNELHTSPSIGIAICPRDGQTMEQLHNAADAAMYSAKRSGRGLYRFFDPSLNRVDQEEFQLEQALGEGLRQGQFILHFQPLVQLKSMTLVGYEALVRWQHPTLGLIYPNRFIPIAERSGFIVPLGREVLRQACQQLRQWPAHLSLSVNVSPKELDQTDFAEQLLAELNNHQLAPSRLQLEVTETSILERQELAIAQLQQLKEAGVGIALDDFGKGYAGFAHLQALPLTRLKIDRSLVAQLANSHDDNLIVSSTITLARRLSLQVVAEGVETREQLVCLKLAGCSLVQGYHLGRPVPAEQLAKLESEISAMRASA